MKNKFLKELLHIIYPPNCVFCTEALEADEVDDMICEACKREIKVISAPVCENCGRKILVKGKCSSCNSERRSFDSGLAVYIYEGRVRESILRFKRNKGYVYKEFFGRRMAELATDKIKGADYICAVPNSKRKKREKGYNQAELLAKELSKELGSEYIDCLSRDIDTPEQSSLKQSERKGNVKGVFSFKGKISIKGKTLVLVDDILTTGSTANECARVLKKAGAREVIVYCLSCTKEL